MLATKKAFEHLGLPRLQTFTFYRLPVGCYLVHHHQKGNSPRTKLKTPGSTLEKVR